MQDTFWSGPFDFCNTSSIDDLLSREEFTIEDLLDHKEIISECKYLNHDLVEYLSRADVIEKLIKYIIQKPTDANAPNPSKDTPEGKYPYIASELFTCEVHDMLDCLFDNKHLLELLFSFLDQPAPLDPANVAYFCKVMVVLIGKKHQDLVDFIKATNQLEKLLNHIGLYSVMELLIRIGWDDGNGAEQVESKSNHPTWLHDADLVTRLVARLHPKYDDVPDVHVNAACALVDVVVKTGPQVPSLGLLVQDLLKQEVLDTVFEYLFSGSASSLTNCLSVIIVLVQSDTDRRLQMQHDVQQELETNPMAAEDRRQKWEAMLVERDAMTPILSHVVLALPKLLEYVMTPSELAGVQIRTQSGHVLSPPFGASRLKIVELVLALVRAEITDVNKGLVSSNCFKYVLDACFAYPSNNMLHGLVESIVLCVLDVDAAPEEEQQEPGDGQKPGFEHLKEAMFKPDRGNILAKIRTAYAASVEVVGANKGCRVGYMGHLIRMCAGISDVCTIDSLQRWGLGKEEINAWVELCEGALAADIAKQQIVLGGSRPGAPLQPPDEAMMEGLEFHDMMSNDNIFGALQSNNDDDFFNWGNDDDE